jgi:hypothetical protein
MENIAPIILAITGLLTALGVAAKFVWTRLENRFALIEQSLEACKQERTFDLERRGIMLTVIELLWAHVCSVSPQHEVLKRSEKLLDQIKAMDAEARAKDA